MGGCDRDPAGRGVSSSSRRRGWGCGRRAAVSSGDKKPEGGGGGGPAASAQRCSLSVAARCSTSNPLARITWPRGAGQRLLSPRARGCCGREWWPVCAGAPRPTPQATTRATRAPEGDTSYPVHLPAPVSSFSARLPTVTSALPDASWETGPKRRGVCGQTCVGEAFLIPACHSPLFHLCFCCLRLWHVLVTQTRKCRWFHSKGMPFVSCSGCGGSPWLSHKCISVLFNSCMY